MNRFATIVRNITFLSIGNVVSRVMGTAFYIALARYLGESGLGKFAFANSFTTLFATIGDMGLNTIAVRSVAQDRSLAAKYLGNIVVIRVLLGIIAFMITGMAIFFTQIPRDTAPIVWLMAGSALFLALCNGYRWVFQAFERLQYEAALTIVESVLIAGGGLLILVLGYGLIELTSVRLVCAGLVFITGLALAIKRIVRPAFELDVAFCKKLMIRAIPFMMLLIFSQIYFNLDTVLLGFLRGDEEVGRYNAAYRIIKMLQMVPGFFQLAALPAFVDAASKPADEFVRVVGRAFRYMVIVAVAFGVIMTAFAEPIILLLFTDRFIEAVPMLQILIWMNFFFFVTNVSSSVAISRHRERMIMKIGGISTALNAALNLAFIPIWGGTGAGLAILISEAFQCAVFLYQVKYMLNTLKLSRLFIRPIMAGAGAALVAVALRDTHFIVGIGAALLTYAGGLLVFRAVPPDDMKLILNVIKREDEQQPR